MNLSVSSFVVFAFASYFADTADTQRSRAERLQTSLEEEKAKQLGAYTLEEKIGAGGMGVVYKARHALLRRPTAIKLLPVEKIGAHSLARFEREVQHTAALTHPSTVAIYDYGRSADGVFYYAMEYLDGIDLDALVRRTGALPPARVLYILAQVCDALAEAHEAGLVHRDIKPANIMICRMAKRADVAKVLDFGLVKELDADVHMTQDDAVAGTPAYIAPEAVSAPSTVGPVADLYALGAVAYWLLTGRPVFVGKTVVAVFAAHLHRAPEPPSLHAPGIPEALDELVLRCLAKEPSARPASARELLRAIEELSEPEALRWTAAERQAWWDEFERVRGTEPPQPVGSADAILTVDPRARGPIEVSRVDVVGETVLQGRASK
jgi:serine/threonine-protein kinase